MLGERKADGEASYSVDGFHTETPPQHFEGNGKEYQIEYQITHLWGDAEAPVENRGQSSYTTHRDVIGQEEYTKAHTTHKHG